MRDFFWAFIGAVAVSVALLATVVVAASMLPGRIVYVVPKPTPTPVVREIELWIDDVNYWCSLESQGWKCEVTGKTRQDGETLDE